MFHWSASTWIQGAKALQGHLKDKELKHDSRGGKKLCRAGIYYLFCCHYLRANKKIPTNRHKLLLLSREIKCWGELQLTITSRCNACFWHSTCSRVKIMVVKQFVPHHMLTFSVCFIQRRISSSALTVTQLCHVSFLGGKMEEAIHCKVFMGDNFERKGSTR